MMTDKNNILISKLGKSNVVSGMPKIQASISMLGIKTRATCIHLPSVLSTLMSCSSFADIVTQPGSMAKSRSNAMPMKAEVRSPVIAVKLLVVNSVWNAMNSVDRIKVQQMIGGESRGTSGSSSGSANAKWSLDRQCPSAVAAAPLAASAKAYKASPLRLEYAFRFTDNCAFSWNQLA